MNKELNLLIFKRDLRVEDNRTLYECFKNSDKFIPIFIFNPDIIINFCDRRLSFIVDIMLNLRKKLNLYVFKGTDEEVITKILQKYSVKKIFTSFPLTKSGKERNNRLLQFSKSKGIEFVEVFDNVLADFTKINFKKVYAHFYNEWKKNLDLKILHDPDYNLKIHYDQEFEESTLNLLSLFDTVPKTNWDYNFGMDRIKTYNFYKYSDLRNNLSEDYSSKLSPYIRFGVISIRKLYKLAFDKSEDFIKELAWREFWYHITYHFEELDELEFQEKRRGMSWENNEKYIESFFEARTGYPIVDAAIVQLKTENWMHNRARLIVGSFLTKDLLTDWRIGEKFFAQYLLDYDESVNIGNWQWVASVGPDPKPLRIFNPVIQAQKFDPETKYIKKYLPELSKFKPYELHDPIKYSLIYHNPIIIHSEQVQKIKNFYESSQKDR